MVNVSEEEGEDDTSSQESCFDSWLLNPRDDVSEKESHDTVVAGEVEIMSIALTVLLKLIISGCLILITT